MLAQQLKREQGYTFVLHLRVVAQRAELVNHLPDLSKRRRQAGSKHVFDNQFAAVALLRTPDEPTAVFGANATVIAAIWGRVPRTYIRCSEDQAIPMAAQDQFIAEADALMPRNSYTVRTLKAGHLPFISMPKKIDPADRRITVLKDFRWRIP